MEHYKNLSLEPIRYQNLEGSWCVEEFRDIKNYEGTYQVSDLGRIKSLNRVVLSKNKILKKLKGIILRPTKDKHGYLKYELSLNSKSKTVKGHQEVSFAFMGFCKSKMDLLTIDHIDEIKINNALCNLQIITHRNNSSKSMKTGVSSYRGVDFNKSMNKWRARILISKKRLNLGYFDLEIDAHNAYQNKLKETI